MFGMALVFGLVLLGCNAETGPEIRVTFQNNSSHSTVVTMETGKGWTPAQFTLPPGGTQVVTTNQSVTTVGAQITNGSYIQHTWDSSTNTYTFTNQ